MWIPRWREGTAQAGSTVPAASWALLIMLLLSEKMRPHRLNDARNHFERLAPPQPATAYAMDDNKNVVRGVDCFRNLTDR